MLVLRRSISIVCASCALVKGNTSCKLTPVNYDNLQQMKSLSCSSWNHTPGETRWQDNSLFRTMSQVVLSPCGYLRRLRWLYHHVGMHHRTNEYFLMLKLYNCNESLINHWGSENHNHNSIVRMLVSLSWVPVNFYPNLECYELCKLTLCSVYSGSTDIRCNGILIWLPCMPVVWNIPFIFGWEGSNSTQFHLALQTLRNHSRCSKIISWGLWRSLWFSQEWLESNSSHPPRTGSQLLCVLLWDTKFSREGLPPGKTGMM